MRPEAAVPAQGPRARWGQRLDLDVRMSHPGISVVSYAAILNMELPSERTEAVPELRSTGARLESPQAKRSRAFGIPAATHRPGGDVITRTDLLRIAALGLAVIHEAATGEHPRHHNGCDATADADHYLAWLTRPGPAVHAEVRITNITNKTS